MKIAVTSAGSRLDSQVDSRFGRAPYLIVVDTEQDGFRVHDNSRNANAVQGAGVQAGRMVVGLGVTSLITGHVGPKACGVLQAGCVRVYRGDSRTVAEALDALSAGQLKPLDGSK
jgi:predicted Fe-Mo cluster-binding NifX family protein